MTKSRVIITLILIVLISCSKEEKPNQVLVQSDSVTTINMPDYITNNEIPVTQLFDKIEVIPLEDIQGVSQIANIDKISIHDTDIYIFDQRQKSIFVFDMNGGFKFKINRIGEGPGEYLDIIDVSFDFENEQLIVYDRNQYKFVFYDLSGNFINEVSTKLVGNNIYLFPDIGYLFFRNNWFGFQVDENQTYNNIIILDQDNLNPMSEIYPANMLLRHWSFGTWGHFSKNYKDEILFSNYSDFNIYRIKLDSFEIKYKIKVNNDREMNFDQLFHDTPLPHDISSRIWSENTVWGINSFYETKDYIHYHYRQDQMKSSLIDKKSNQIITYSNIHNDIANHRIINRFYNLDSNNVTILVGQYGDIMDIINDYRGCCMSDSVIEFYSSKSGINDNPYIIIGKLNPSDELFNFMN